MGGAARAETWLGARNIQTAELHLNPADLGPIDVRIQIGSDQSSINFSSQNATVRELLEANIHRLRDMIAEQNQGQQQASNDQGGSSDQSGSESEQTGQAMAGFSDDSSVDAEELGPRTTAASNVSSDSVVDAYI
jgi:flagellar hook-length control protein FliK